MSGIDLGSILGFLGGNKGGYGGMPVNPGYGTSDPQYQATQQSVSKPNLGSSNLASYAAPPVGAQPSFMPSSAGFQQFNMAGPLSGPTGSTVQQQPDDQGTPWYKNPAILQAAAGVGGALLQNHNESANRAQQQQRIDLEKRQYDDQHQRAQQTSEALNPIIARLLGQMMSQQPHKGTG